MSGFVVFKAKKWQFFKYLYFASSVPLSTQNTFSLKISPNTHDQSFLNSPKVCFNIFSLLIP